MGAAEFAAAQDIFGSIPGMSPTHPGKRLQRQVTITNEATLVSRNLKPTKNGYSPPIDCQPEKYSVTAEQTGFKTNDKEGQCLSAGSADG